MADAPGAIAEALRPMARIVKPAGTGAGEDVVLDGSSSGAALNRTITYSWTGVGGDPVFVGTTDGPTATVTVPAVGLVTVRLTVTDDLGRTDTQEVTLGRKPSSGGGGEIHPLMVFALGLLLARRRRQP